MEEAAGRLGDRTALSLQELRELLCRDCDFFDEEHEDDLECSSFRMLRGLMVRGELTPARLGRALAAEPEQARDDPAQ